MIKKFKAWAAVLALIVVAVPAGAVAITTLSQGYSTTDPLVTGSLVSLENNFSDTVKAASNSNVDGILGVVINDGGALLSLSSEQSHQVQVATSGVVPVLVSNINGDIHQGDEITASPISGVGMKATINAKVVGVSQSGLTKNGSSNESYTDKSGQKHSVLVGQIPVLINVSYYFKQPDKTIIPSTIQNVANAFAGRTVSTVPILISMGIFIITMVVVSSIVYSMIRSSIISTGRNPLSQSAIYRQLLSMSTLVVGILAVSMVAIYMVLTKF
jgi:hypothetical protein